MLVLERMSDTVLEGKERSIPFETEVGITDSSFMIPRILDGSYRKTVALSVHVL